MENLDEIRQYLLNKGLPAEADVRMRNMDLSKLYKDLRYDAATSAATTVAAGDYPLFANSATAPSLTTNMSQANQFSSGCAFLVLGITCDVVDGISGTLSTTADHTAVRQGSVFSFSFNEQPSYFRRLVAQMPRSMDPGEFRPPNWLGQSAFWIPPQTQFSATVNVPTAITITASSKVKWVVSIHGYYVRPLG